MDHDSENPRKRSPLGFVLICFLAIAAFFLLLEHRAHLLGVLPYLLLAACPLLHVFGHRHGGHGKSKPGRRPGEKDGEPPGHAHH